MKFKTFAMAALLGIAAFVQQPLAARAQDDVWRCGNDLQWWWKIHGPRSVENILTIDRTIIQDRGQVPGSNLEGFKVAFYVRNIGNRALPARTAFSLSHSIANTDGGYWDPDNPFDPNNPGNPYANQYFEVASKGYLGALKPGKTMKIVGTLYAPLDAVKNGGVHEMSLNVGWDDDGICPPWPWHWPIPGPWWLDLSGQDASLSGLAFKISSVSDPEPSPWKGYDSYRVILVIKNNSRRNIPAGTPIAMSHVVGGNGDNPNPDDPFDPNNPGNPYAEWFREALLGDGSVLPAVQRGATVKITLKVNVPSAKGFGNILAVHVGK